jgi:hypothetical protein
MKKLIVLSCALFSLVSCNKYEFPEGLLDRKIYNVEGFCDQYIIFNSDETVEISISTCESGGIFGGGTSIGAQVLRGKYEIIGKSIKINLQQDFNFECNNGFKGKWNKEFYISTPTSPPAHDYPIFTTQKSTELYLLPSDKNWREWRIYNQVYNPDLQCN